MHNIQFALVLQLDPVSGPVEGGTVVTISGSNLGQRAEDIQGSVTVAGVPCNVIHSRYEVSSRQVRGTPVCTPFFYVPYSLCDSSVTLLCRIVCETTSSGGEKSEKASVKVMGGGVGLSAQCFHFQVN